MYIDVDLFVKSVLIGLCLGFFAGLFVCQYALDLFARKVFDSLLLLRQTAREQMEQHKARVEGPPLPQKKAASARNGARLVLTPKQPGEKL